LTSVARLFNGVVKEKYKRLCHADPLLGGDREIGDCTAVRREQRNDIFCALR
jgi:hypothetical protein